MHDQSLSLVAYETVVDNAAGANSHNFILWNNWTLHVNTKKKAEVLWLKKQTSNALGVYSYVNNHLCITNLLCTSDCLLNTQGIGV